MQQIKEFCPAQYYTQVFFLTKPRKKLSLTRFDKVITTVFLKCSDWCHQSWLSSAVTELKDIVATYNKKNKVVNKITQLNI